MGRRGDLAAGRHHRRAGLGQEKGQVKFPLEPAGGVRADGGRGRRDLRHHRRRTPVDDHVRAVGQHRRLGEVHAETGGGADRRGGDG
jgi:hypothetical protein